MCVRTAGVYLYEFSFTETVDSQTDVLSESEGVLLVIQEPEIPFVIGTEIDFESEPQRGFRFNSPNAIQHDHDAKQNAASDS